MPGVKSARYPPTHDIIIGMAHIFFNGGKNTEIQPSFVTYFH